MCKWTKKKTETSIEERELQRYNWKQRILWKISNKFLFLAPSCRTMAGGHVRKDAVSLAKQIKKHSYPQPEMSGEVSLVDELESKKGVWQGEKGDEGMCRKQGSRGLK